MRRVSTVVLVFRVSVAAGAADRWYRDSNFFCLKHRDMSPPRRLATLRPSLCHGAIQRGGRWRDPTATHITQREWGDNMLWDRSISRSVLGVGSTSPRSGEPSTALSMGMDQPFRISARTHTRHRQILERYLLNFSKGGKVHEDDLGLLDDAGDGSDAVADVTEDGSYFARYGEPPPERRPSSYS